MHPPFVLPAPPIPEWYQSDYAADEINATLFYVEALAYADSQLPAAVHLDAALDINVANPSAQLLELADAVAFTSPLPQHLFEHVAAIPTAWMWQTNRGTLTRKNNIITVNNKTNQCFRAVCTHLATFDYAQVFL